METVLWNCFPGHNVTNLLVCFGKLLRNLEQDIVYHQIVRGPDRQGTYETYFILYETYFILYEIYFIMFLGPLPTQEMNVTITKLRRYLCDVVLKMVISEITFSPIARLLG